MMAAETKGCALDKGWHEGRKDDGEVTYPCCSTRGTSVRRGACSSRATCSFGRFQWRRWSLRPRGGCMFACLRFVCLLGCFLNFTLISMAFCRVRCRLLLGARLRWQLRPKTGFSWILHCFSCSGVRGLPSSGQTGLLVSHCQVLSWNQCKRGVCVFLPTYSMAPDKCRQRAQRRPWSAVVGRQTL